jgi:hypothetical protein
MMQLQSTWQMKAKGLAVRPRPCNFLLAAAKHPHAKVCTIHQQQQEQQQQLADPGQQEHHQWPFENSVQLLQNPSKQALHMVAQ